MNIKKPLQLKWGLVCSKSLALHDSVCLSVFRDLDPGLKAALREFLAARGVNSKLAGSILHHLLQKERSQYVNWLKTLEKTFAKNHWLYPHLKIYKLSFLAESRVNIFVVLMRKLEQLLPFMSMIRYSNPSSALSPVENMWNPYTHIPREFNCLTLNLPHKFLWNFYILHSQQVLIMYTSMRRHLFPRCTCHIRLWSESLNCMKIVTSLVRRGRFGWVWQKEFSKRIDAMQWFSFFSGGKYEHHHNL